MAFQAYRCRFCGDVFMGGTAPSHCPYCGAHAQYMVPIGTWRAPALQNLSPESKANLEKALNLEVDNAAYYALEAGRLHDPVWQGIFKYLARVEGEHAGTIRKALGLQNNPAPGPLAGTAEFRSAITEVDKRESRAGDFYRQALSEAKEERVQDIFRCLIEIEADHLRLAQETLHSI